MKRYLMRRIFPAARVIRGSFSINTFRSRILAAGDMMPLRLQLRIRSAAGA
jgi:hypothetical protein